MNATPERICEALGWLYGGEWAFDGAGLYTSTSGDWMEFDENHTPELHRDCWLRDCGDDLAHALEVTAPWEWKDPKAKYVLMECGGDGFDAGIPPHGKRVQWFVQLKDADYTRIEGDAQDEAAAKSAARAAYLRWMRGGLDR